MKITIITQIRNESKRLKEWVEFHKYYYDIDLFYFFLDYPEDDSLIILNELCEKYPIKYEFTDGLGEYIGNNCAVATERQRKSFKIGYNKLKNNFDWVLIFDVDEWLVPINIDNHNLKEYLDSIKENMVYFPMYNFKPPFDYNKSITEQSMYRWSTKERFRYEHGFCGKSAIRGKIFLEHNFDINIHTGPESSELFHKNIDFESKNHIFRLYQWQQHLNHRNSNYEKYDDKIIKMFNKIK